MPAGYFDLRTELKIYAMELKNKRDCLDKKIATYSGFQQSSVENINKRNNERVEVFNQYIDLIYPDLKRKKEEVKKPSGTVEDLIEEYKRLFPQQSGGKNKSSMQ
jgi:hypothetical protein